MEDQLEEITTHTCFGKADYISHQWIVDVCALTMETQLESANFASLSNPQHEFFLRFNAKEGSDDSLLLLSLSAREFIEEYNLSCYCTISLIDANGLKRYSTEFQHMFNSQSHTCGPLDFVGLNEVKNPLNELLVEGKLSISCEMRIQTVVSKSINFDDLRLLSRQSMIHTLKLVLDAGTKADVYLVVNGNEFRSNRTILLTRAAEFKLIFGVDIEAILQTENRVEISYLTSRMFEILMQFCFTGKLATQYTYKLLNIAVERQIPQLKQMCIKRMQTFLEYTRFYSEAIEKATELANLITIAFEEDHALKEAIATVEAQPDQENQILQDFLIKVRAPMQTLEAEKIDWFHSLNDGLDPIEHYLFFIQQVLGKGHLSIAQLSDNYESEDDKIEKDDLYTAKQITRKCNFLSKLNNQVGVFIEKILSDEGVEIIRDQSDSIE